MNKARLLKLVFGDTKQVAIGVEDWTPVIVAARSQVVLIRLVRALQRVGVPIADQLAAAEKAETERIRQTLEAQHQLATALNADGIKHVFVKAFQHWPDMGHDIDLLVEPGRPDLTRIVNSMGGTRQRDGLINRIAAKQNWILAGSPSPLEVHRGRTGLVGEYQAFARDIMARSVIARHGAASELAVPCPEDEALLRVTQRIYSHFGFRIGDILSAVDLEKRGYDHGNVLDRAKKLGVVPGVNEAERIVKQALELNAAGLELGKGRVARLLFDRWVALVANRNWSAAARTALIPLLGVYTFGRNAIASRS